VVKDDGYKELFKILANGSREEERRQKMRRERIFDGMENVEGNRSVLLQAFGDLRKQGLIARANFRCCQSCAGYEISEKVSKMSKEEAGKVKGCTYWHQQDEDDLKERGSLYLAYGNLETTGNGTVGLPTVEVGKMVLETLKKYGLTVEWDGSEGSRIQVDLTKLIPKEIMELIEGPSAPEAKKRKKEKLKVTSWDKNAFSVMGNTMRALRKMEIAEQDISLTMEKAREGDYSHLLSVCTDALREAGYEVQ
jgi:hypothetical protein